MQKRCKLLVVDKNNKLSSDLDVFANVDTYMMTDLKELLSIDPAAQIDGVILSVEVEKSTRYSDDLITTKTVYHLNEKTGKFVVANQKDIYSNNFIEE